VQQVDPFGIGHFHVTGGRRTLTILASKVRADFPLEHIQEGLALYRALVKGKSTSDLAGYRRIMSEI